MDVRAEVNEDDILGDFFKDPNLVQQAGCGFN